MDNLNKGENSFGDRLDFEMKKSKSQSLEILSTPQISRKVDSPFADTKRPRTSDLTYTHVPDIASRRQVLEALKAREVSLEREVNRAGLTLEAHGANNDDFRRARFLLRELKRAIHKLSTQPT